MRKSKISSTAWIVVMCQLGLRKSRRWKHLVSDNSAAFYHACIDYCSKHTLGFWVSSHLPIFNTGVDFILAYGAPQHFALRKAAIADIIAKSADTASPYQLVVIGGGFDLLAYNTSMQSPGSTCFEIDTPDMSQHKQILLNQVYGATPANFVAIAADLSKTSILEVLSQHPSFDIRKPTIFVAEGVSMYLSVEDFKNLLSYVRQLSTGNSMFLFTAIANAKKSTGRVGTWLKKIILSVNREKFSFSLHPEDMGVFLAQNQFGLKNLVSYADLQISLRTSWEIKKILQQNGEYIVCSTPFLSQKTMDNA